VAESFSLLGSFREAAPYGSGHINDTFVLLLDQAGTPVRYILQRINDRIFKDVPALMSNISRVTEHALGRLREEGNPDSSRRSLVLLRSREGAPWHRDEHGGWWRCYPFIEKARTYDLVDTPRLAREAARAFGEFQNLLVDLPGGRLNETIPNFHNTRQRLENLRRAWIADSAGRAAEARAEMAFAMARESLADALIRLQESGDIPERITHNDTKLNNVMIDELTLEGICVIDLDTVMPGLALYDFGDMVRSATNSAAEDERDLSKVHARIDIFEGLVEGYLASASRFLNRAEVDHLAVSGRLITFESGMRFLTDFLQGDVYYKIRYPRHNLDRARNQFALLGSLESQREAMEFLVRKHASSAASTPVSMAGLGCA